MRALFASLLLSLTLIVPTVHAASADQKFRTIWEREWAWRLEQFPLLATSVGEHAHNARLGNVDAAAQQGRAEYWRAVRAQINALDRKALSAGARIDHAIYLAQLDSLIGNVELRGYLMPLSSDSSFYADLLFLPRQHPFRSVHDYRHYIARLRAIPAYFEQHIGLLREGLRLGVSVPRVTLVGRELAIQEIAQTADPTQSAFFAPLKNFPAAITADEAAALRTEGAAAITEAVTPAYAHLFTFIHETYIPQARESIGAHALPDGKAFYQRQILDYVTEDLSPQQIHDLGLAEVARIRAAMQAIIDELEFDGDFAEFLQFLRSDPQFYASTPEQLLAAASWIAKRADGQLPKFFGRLPRLPYGVQAVPDTIAAYYTAGRYVPPAAGSTEPGWYWVNTSKLDSRPLYTLAALTLHEAVPGHHLQGALANELGEQPPFRRFSYISAYGEGWALYCEELGHEMGIYRTPYERFGQLTYAMWRANRLVVDTGMHALGWTRAQAIDYMTTNTALSEHEIRTEIDRYISWPGQALSYMIGMIRIRELRAQAEHDLGPRFDLRAFHDAVLATGSVPLPVLRDQVRSWVAQQSNAAP